VRLPPFTSIRGGKLRDWLERHVPKLVGLWDYPRYRLVGRCDVCGVLMVGHSPWALYICERTPLPIEITDLVSMERPAPVRR
jgi:hypothetical protein